MNQQPPKSAALLRPKFGIGVLICIAIIIASQASGNVNALGMVLGGGVGILLGLTQLTRRPQAVVDDAGDGR